MSGCEKVLSHCALCKERLKDIHSHPGRWKVELQQFLLRYSAVPLTACVCRADEISIKKGLAGNFKGDFVPRWVKREIKKQKLNCCVPGCCALADRNCVFASLDTICAACGVTNRGEPATAAAATDSFHVCKEHYHTVYRYCNPESVIECALCSTKRRHCTTSDTRWPFRPVPQSESINVLLHEVGDFDKSVTVDSRVCNKCYQFCLKLLAQCDEDDLWTPERVIQELRKKVDGLNEKFRQCRDFSTDHNEVALLHTAIVLGEQMLSDKAMKFPHLYCKYSKYLQSLACNAPLLPRYKVLVYVGKEYGSLMSSVCPCNRLGRILYRTMCDPFLMLSHAMGTATIESHKNEDFRDFIPPVEPVACYLSDKVHDLAKHLLQEREKTPVSTSTFNLESFIACVDPDLWKTISILTQSSSGKMGRKQSDSHIHEMKVRIAYTLCVIVFCATGGRCSVPLHILLTDYIETSGGSSEIITILNRLGAVASKETLDRHIMRVSAQRVEEGLLKDLNNQVFTVATTDNIDFLQSHASVYSGSQHRSWHGTSVQIVQPQQRLVTMLVDHEQGITGVNTSSTQLEPSTSVSQDPTLDQVVMQRIRPRSSPINMPSKQGCSPAPKRARTFCEAISLGEVSESNMEPLHTGSRQTTYMGGLGLQFNDFLQSDEELVALKKLEYNLFTYLLQKSVLKPDHVLFSFKDHIVAMEGKDMHAEPAVIVYLSIVDMHADTLEAMSEVAVMLYKEYLVSTGAQYLIVAGDAKTYLRLKEIKQEYGSELDWLLPFIGDWHTLYNYQKTLMKVYYEAGLKNLAMASGFRAETLTSLINASNFKRTHTFLMQVWEVLYLHFFDQYKSHLSCSNPVATSECDDMLASVRTRLLDCVEDDSYDDYVQANIAMDSEYKTLHDNFIAFVRELASKDDTWKFWHDFVFHDCLAYVGLYYAIRGGIWNLRMASLKEMCPIFTAFDRVNYLKILPQHFSEILCLPEHIKQCFEKGGFVCNIRGTRMHAVALDEAHEMLVNKDIKTSVVRPSKEYLNKIMYYYPIRAKVCQTLKEQIYPPTSSLKKTVSIFDSTPYAARCVENIENMKAKLQDLCVLAIVEDNRGLLALDGKVATPEQHKDLMSFRDIGQQYYEAYVKYYILRDPSAQVPLRLRRLQNFSIKKSQVLKKIKQKEREQNIVSRCIRRQLAWSVKTQKVGQHSGEQYLELPRAICTPSGVANKGLKYYTTKFLEKRYSAVIVSMVPGGWVPCSVILEGMFLINTCPLVTHCTMKDYAQFLVKRFALPYFIKGTQEVHIVFDSPGHIPRTPKAFEQSHNRDMYTERSDHEHFKFTDVAAVPHKWHEHLNCHLCKRQLVVYLGVAFISLAPVLLSGEQKLVVAGCYEGGKAIGISPFSVEVCPLLTSNAEETDTRVWLHAMYSAGTKKLLFSTEADGYHIGLPLLDFNKYDVYVQLSPITSCEQMFLHLNQLHEALNADPDLALVPIGLRANVLQTLFICSGCDYISFFAGFGKATVMKHFFQNAWFITGTHEIPGTLAETAPDTKETGFLSFIRLIGTMYFKKHLVEFIVNTPRALYMSLAESGVGPMQQHKKFIGAIREAVWNRIQFEDELPPSFESLWRHWQRTCWVSNMWSQATKNQMVLLDLTQCGWKIVDDKLEIDWESDENLSAVRERVGLLFRGCSCSSVKACSTRRCGCVKKGCKCGPGCRCKNCSNVPNLSNTVTVETSVHGGTHVQQCSSIELLEVEQEELLHNELIRMEHMEEFIGDDNDNGEDDEFQADEDLEELDA